jgi:hypothetical protein
MWSLLVHSHSLLLPPIFFSSSFFIFFFFSLYLFFCKAELIPSWYGWIMMRGAHRFLQHLDFCVSQHQEPSVWCWCLLQSVPHHLGVPSVQLVQFSYPRASHAPHSFHLNLKMVSDQKYPRVHTIQTTCSCFYCFSRRNFFVCLFLMIIRAIFQQCFIYGHKLDHWGGGSCCIHDWWCIPQLHH